MPCLYRGYQREDRHDQTGDGAACRGWYTWTGPRHDPEKGPWYVSGLRLGDRGQGGSHPFEGRISQALVAKHTSL